MATCSSAMGVTAAATSSVSALSSSSSTTRAASAKIVVRAPVAILSHVSLKRGEITLRSSQRDTSASDGRSGVFRHVGAFPVDGTRRAKRSPVASAEPAVSNSETAGSSTIDVVRQVISEQLAVKLSELEPTSKFADLGADSLDTVEIMMKLEEKFGITMEEDGTEKIATVQDAATLIDQIKDK